MTQASFDSLFAAATSDQMAVVCNSPDSPLAQSLAENFGKLADKKIEVSVLFDRLGGATHGDWLERYKAVFGTHAAIGEIRIIPFSMRYRLNEQIHLLGEFVWSGEKAHKKQGWEFSSGDLTTFSDSEASRLQSAITGAAFGQVFTRSKTIAESLQWMKAQEWLRGVDGQPDFMMGVPPIGKIKHKQPLNA